jgi:hypothetical protein
MAYSNFTCAPDMTSDATFRAWGSAVSAALTAVGLAIVADTGTINWTTVTKPGAIDTSAGYEIRKLVDLTGNNVYFRIDYGTSANTSRPGMRITIGSGSNGSGTITGANAYTGRWMGCLNSTSSLNCMVSSDGTYLTVVLWFSTTAATSTYMAFGFGRTKDDAGVDTPDGVNYLHQHCNTGLATSAVQTFIPKNGGGLPTERAGTNIYHCAAPSTGTGTYGTTLGQWPVFVSRGAADNTCMTALAVFPADHGGAAAAGSVIECLLYGTTHYYLFPGQPGSVNLWTLNGNTNICGLAWRYE